MEAVSADNFFRACGFSVADYQRLGNAPEWHTAASACSILARYDKLLVMGDSLTRQVPNSAVYRLELAFRGRELTGDSLCAAAAV